MSQGAIYLPTHWQKVAAMVTLAQVKPGMKVVDLGSGDGRLVIALTQAGAEAHGYEINPILVLWSKINLRRAGLQKQAKIFRQNFWSVNLNQYEVVMIFGMTHVMDRLEQKLLKELKPNTLVISNIFQFKNLKQMASQNGIYVYRI